MATARDGMVEVVEDERRGFLFHFNWGTLNFPPFLVSGKTKYNAAYIGGGARRVWLAAAGDGRAAAIAAHALTAAGSERAPRS
jgi:hypothetical protein